MPRFLRVTQNGGSLGSLLPKTSQTSSAHVTRYLASHMQQAAVSTNIGMRHFFSSGSSNGEDTKQEQSKFWRAMKKSDIFLNVATKSLALFGGLYAYANKEKIKALFDKNYKGYGLEEITWKADRRKSEHEEVMRKTNQDIFILLNHSGSYTVQVFPTLQERALAGVRITIVMFDTSVLKQPSNGWQKEVKIDPDLVALIADFNKAHPDNKIRLGFINEDQHYAMELYDSGVGRAEPGSYEYSKNSRLIFYPKARKDEDNIIIQTYKDIENKLESPHRYPYCFYRDEAHKLLRHTIWLEQTPYHSRGESASSAPSVASPEPKF